MTREQASEVVAMTLDKIATQIMGAEMMDNETRQGLEHTIRAFTMARTALRGPQPDPETGLVPCGCGGIAELHKDVYRCYWVDCPKCDIQLGYWEYGDDHEPRGKFWSKTLVRDMWNCAMGYRE